MDKFSVTGMSCAACSAHVEKAVAKVPGCLLYTSMERRKMKADYFLSEKKYRHAAYGYLELLQQENLIYMTEELDVYKRQSISCEGVSVVGMRSLTAF